MLNLGLTKFLNIDLSDVITKTDEADEVVDPDELKLAMDAFKYGENGIDPAVAEAFSDKLKAELQANGGVNGGNPAMSTQTVLATSTGKIQIGSASKGNTVEVFVSGEQYAKNNPVTRFQMNLGSIQTLTGVSAGYI